MKINKILGLFLLLVLLSIGYAVENFSLLKKASGSSSCSERKNCSSCLNGYDNTGSLCYWCKTSGCIDPDKDPSRYNSSCTTDKKCI